MNTWPTESYVRRRVAICLLLFQLSVNAADGKRTTKTDLFESDRIVPISLQIGEPELQRLAATQSGNSPVRPNECVLVAVVDGRTFTNAQIHLLGHGSFLPILDKPNLSLNIAISAERRPFVHKRILLKNSRQDDSLLRWKLASELFLKAGLPAPRVNFARVELNGRNLGLYFMLEPTDKPFLARAFGSSKGSLYEGNYDIGVPLEVDSANPAKSQEDRAVLAIICREPNLQLRWQGLGARLDIEKFVSFMAMEMLIGHEDGYCRGQRNYRLYHDPRMDRMVFIPHGMDQVFIGAAQPLEPVGEGLPPGAGGLVARAVMETEEGKRLYRKRVAELGEMVYGNGDLIARIEAIANLLRPAISETDGSQRKRFDTSILELQTVVKQRTDFVLGAAQDRDNRARERNPTNGTEKDF